MITARLATVHRAVKYELNIYRTRDWNVAATNHENMLYVLVLIQNLLAVQ